MDNPARRACAQGHQRCAADCLADGEGFIIEGLAGIEGDMRTFQLVLPKVSTNVRADAHSQNLSARAFEEIAGMVPAIYRIASTRTLRARTRKRDPSAS
jgi:hypothetical protein